MSRRALVALLPVAALPIAPWRPSAPVLASVVVGSLLWAARPELATIWVRRSVPPLLAAPLAYVVVVGLDAGPEQPLMWPVAVATLTVLTLVVGLVFRETATKASPQAR